MFENKTFYPILVAELEFCNFPNNSTWSVSGFKIIFELSNFLCILLTLPYQLILSNLLLRC